ncbi:MAG: squalene/phytoene synthase family protein [Pseudomonadota bacterium]
MIDDPLSRLAIGYAPAHRRAALVALFALDAALGQVLRTTREPMVGQMRLAWWREALARLDAAPPPGEPVLQALAVDVVPAGLTGAMLAELVDGWEPLLGDIDDTAIAAHASRRGAALFTLAGTLLGAGDRDPLTLAGQGWALADLAANLSDPALVGTVRASAESLLTAAIGHRWSRNGRPLGAMTLIARTKASGSDGVSTVFRLGWHRLTGR